MGVNSADAPQWFISSFVRSCLGAGATVSEEEIRAVGNRLIEQWSAPDRRYHNLRHLADVLHRVDLLAEETHDPDVVRLAAWYHGAIFDASRKVAHANQGGEQTAVSAELARKELTQLGVSERKTERVAHLVDTIVRHKPDPGDMDSAVLNDADLAFLASEPQRYKEYMADIREEYAHIPVEVFLDARIRVLTKLLGRPSLFKSPMGAAWEEPARQNLDAELHRLLKERKSLSTSSGTSGAA
jgi:predicted metal-dependent HD superfamily phosphohydrolase